MRGRALLADEVGLGKTVEAAIILAELWRRRLGRLSRVGQTRSVHVFNLVAAGTIEETLLEQEPIEVRPAPVDDVDDLAGRLAQHQRRSDGEAVKIAKEERG